MMLLPQPTPVDELLDIGRDLIVQEQFDAGVVLELLDDISITDLDVQVRGAIQHARLVALNVFGGGVSHTAVARFALSRVVVLLEEHADCRDGDPMGTWG